MSVVWAQPQFCRPDMAREPLGVRTGCDPILATVQEEDWRGYLRGVKPPRGDVCEVVIHHPPRPAFHGLPGDGAQPGPSPRECGMICRGELFQVELGRRQAVLERRASLGGGVELCRAGGRHAGEPVQALGVERSQSGHADDA